MSETDGLAQELLVVKGGSLFLCASPGGDVRAASGTGEGLYSSDTRILSDLQLSVNGVRPAALPHGSDRGYRAVVTGVLPEIVDSTGMRVPEATIEVTRTLLIDDGLYEGIEVVNRCPVAVELALQLKLAADFADVFEVRGFHGRVGSARGTPALLDGGVAFRFEAASGVSHETGVQCDPPPARWQVVDKHVYADWDLKLAPCAQHTMVVTVKPTGRPERGGRRSVAQVERALDRASEEWRLAGTAIEAHDARLGAVITASIRDLYLLMTPAPGGSLPAAGVPWYVAAFGRDSLLTAYQCLAFRPQVARDTLSVLARLQARGDDPWRDAEPGKIPHELRVGELARLGVIPHTPYYGTVDATPLFVILAAEYFRWTGDLALVLKLRSALDAALEWIDRYGDADHDGFVEYQRRSPAGLENQGWKDSPGSIVHRDGTRAQAPIALVEAQGYVYAAKQGAAALYEALGEPARADALRGQAAALRRAFNEVFWDAAEGTFALALDGQKRQVRSVSSNPGHCLLCGIVDDDKAESLATRLMAADMFSGWGVRTLSSQSPAYDPNSYHNGSVWPHDNAIIAAGLKRYGYSAAAVRIAAAMFDAANRDPQRRLPELFSGLARQSGSGVSAYRTSCRPQAWAAAAPFMLLQTLLGLSADAPGNRLRLTEPELLPGLDRLELRNLSVGQSRVDLAFRRCDELTRVSVLRGPSALEVTTTTAYSRRVTPRAGG